MSCKITKMHPEVCEHYCSKVTHGNLITAALTKTDVSDEALIYYMLSVCQHFSTARDSAGRSALHMAASCGRSRMVTWLITHRNGKLEEKDRESGYTALHRSLFYGRINTAVALVKLGSKMNALDEENLSPLEHVMKDAAAECKRNSVWWTCKFSTPGPLDADNWKANSEEYIWGELYSWGSNSNYTLLGTQSREFAELSHFHKQCPNERVHAIHLDKYHCMVTCDTKVYAWGHGLGGRLGLNTDSTVLTPKPVRIVLKPNKYDAGATFSSAQHLAIARDHSIFLDGKGNVWTCGLNEHAILGVVVGEAKALLPVHVTSLKQKDIIGVACGKYHSAAHSVDTLFTWGLNGGQLGHSSNCGQFISTPTKVNRLLDGVNESMLQVCCSDGAIGILASNNVVIILHEFQRRRIALKSTAVFVQLHLFGGKLESATQTPLPHQELHAAIVTKASNLLLWREKDPHLRRCVFNIGRPLLVNNVALNARGCVFTTRDHEVFLGVIKRRKLTAVKSDKEKDKERDVGKSAFHKFLEKDDCVLIKVTKVPRIHRALNVTCDPDGDNFLVLQNNRCKEFPNVLPKVNDGEMEIHDYLRMLQNDSCDEDSLHDFKFIVGHRTFYCHKYILAYASADLSDLVRKSNDNRHVVESVQADIFEQMLKFIYAKKCDLLDLNKFTNKDENSSASVLNIDKEHEINGELSAFAVYTQRPNKSIAKTKESDQNLCDQKLLLLCAKKFGLYSLQKYVELYIEHKRNRSRVCAGCFDQAESSTQYQRDKFLDFSDIDVICKSGEKIRAHKCMLMRLEYFRNMFSARWNQDRKTIKIDYLHIHVQLLLDFIYTNKISNSICDMENLLTLLILSDEFIVEKLRALCEFSLCKYINVKTVANLYQCSILYGSWILKNACSQFIVIHLAELLELRCLDSIEDEHLTDISNIYVNYQSSVFDKRLITPFSCIVNIEEPPSDFSLEFIESTKYQAVEAQKAARKRSRRHKNSSTGELVPHINESTEIIESESNFSDSNNARTQTIPSNRIVAIQTATKSLSESSEKAGDFTNLSMLNNSLVNSSLDESASPDLNRRGSYSKSPGKNTDWRSLPKLSQKARKRLQSAGDTSSSGTIAPSSITNPWKIIEVESFHSSTTFDAVQRDMSEIVKAERLQKENLNKMRNRLLSSTQIEDRAILELEKFYNVDSIEDELIEVRRIESGNVALPIWLPKTKRAEK